MAFRPFLQQLNKHRFGVLESTEHLVTHGHVLHCPEGVWMIWPEYFPDVFQALVHDGSAFAGSPSAPYTIASWVHRIECVRMLGA
jgi:hypothetical protein